jgi:dephospho-CoA kinase
VTADREIRKKRIMERDGMDEHMADLMIDSQEDEERKVEAADFAIYNNGDVAELYRAIDDALVHYISENQL